MARDHWTDTFNSGRCPVLLMPLKDWRHRTRRHPMRGGLPIPGARYPVRGRCFGDEGPGSYGSPGTALALVVPVLRRCQIAPTTAPRVRTAPMAMNQVTRVKVTPIGPYVLLSSTIVDEK
jgi:hypothetical protein